MIYHRFIKGVLDRFVAGLLIVVLSPLALAIVLLLLFSQGKHVFFMQMRTGKKMQHFKMYKFRTLVTDGSVGLGMKNRKFTILGKTLRQSGLDELPQLINILLGQMSFIGPRPLPIAYDDKYQMPHLKRFDVQPGITGWAQVHGRNGISWGKRFELDLWYVGHRSFLLDAKILCMTALAFISSFCKPHEPHMHMEVFDGSNLT